jgi:hypothetical protein
MNDRKYAVFMNLLVGISLTIYSNFRLCLWYLLYLFFVFCLLRGPGRRCAKAVCHMQFIKSYKAFN